MSEPRFPVGWDADRVERLIDHYEGMSEDKLIAEDEAAAELPPGQTIVTVPEELMPAIRRLLAAHTASAATFPACRADRGCDPLHGLDAPVTFVGDSAS